MRFHGLSLAGSALLAVSAFAAPAALPDPTPAQIDDIIQKFAAKEAQFAQARDNYTYKQTAKIQELDDAGNITGRWETDSDIAFTDDGKRTEHVTRSPVPSLHNI